MSRKCPRCAYNEYSHHCASPTCGWSVCYNCDSVYDFRGRFYAPRKKI